MKILNYFKSDKQFDTNFTYNKITLFLPLIICGGIFALTIFLFAFGPYDWHLTNSLEVYTFLILCLICLSLGFYFGTLKKVKDTSLKIDLNKLVYISFFFSIIMYFITLYCTTGKFYPDIITGLFNSGYAYNFSHNNVKSFYSYIVYINIIISPLTCFLTPIILFYFKSLKKQTKFLGVLLIILNLFLGISQGIINAYADIAFKVCLILSLVLFSNIKENTKKNNIKLIATIVFIVLSFFLYYKTVMSNRLLYDASKGNPKTTQKEREKVTEKEIDETFSNAGDFSTATLKKNYALSFLPDVVESPLNHLTSYVTHGYKGLSLSMSEKFTSTYGLGFSDFFRHNLLKIGGFGKAEKSIYKRTYMYKINKEYEWNTGNVWSSFFIYPASDIGFPGTIILVGLIGYFFAIVWKDLIINRNLLAGVLFYQITILICFFSANNQIFQNGATFISFVSIAIIYIITKFIKKEN